MYLSLLSSAFHFRAFRGAKEVTCAKNKDETGLRWHVDWNDSPKCECSGGGGGCRSGSSSGVKVGDC